MDIDLIINDVQRGWSYDEVGRHLVLEQAPHASATGHYNDKYYDCDVTWLGRVTIPDAESIYDADSVIINAVVYTARLSQDGASLLLADQWCDWSQREYIYAYPISQ